MTTLNELATKESINNDDNFLLSDAQSNDAKASAEQLKNYFAPAATETRAGVVTTEAQEFAGDKTLNGSLNVNGEITKDGAPLITDTKISEAEGNAIEKKEDGLFVPQSQVDIIDDNRTTTGNVWSAAKVNTEIENADNKNNYSTEEIIIGYWDDGRPIYRKTIVYSSPITVTENTDISVPNFDLSQVWGFLTCKLLRVREGTSSPMIVNANCRPEGSKLRVLTAGASSYGNLTRLILEYVKIL